MMEIDLHMPGLLEHNEVVGLFRGNGEFDSSLCLIQKLNMQQVITWTGDYQT